MNGHMKTIKAIRVVMEGIQLLTIQVSLSCLVISEKVWLYTCMQSFTLDTLNFQLLMFFSLQFKCMVDNNTK